LSAKIAQAKSGILEETQLSQVLSKNVENKKKAAGELDYVMVNNKIN